MGTSKGFESDCASARVPRSVDSREIEYEARMFSSFAAVFGFDRGKGSEVYSLRGGVDVA